MAWLLTGGAGYIGGHIVASFRRAGLPVVVLDDLSTGLRTKVPADVPLVVGSVLDDELVRRTIREHSIRGVVHLAAKKAVEESVHRPLWYYRENVEGFRTLVQAMVDENVDRLVLSSSAAVYGMPDLDLVTEDTPTVPINPYGETKLTCERLGAAAAVAHGLRYVALRYFNVAGAGEARLGDPSVTNLIPLVLRAVRSGRAPVIFGDDYPTSDGTCIRDYIHVADLADAHVTAAQQVDELAPGAVYNVSRGQGASVRDVIDTVARVTGRSLSPVVAPRRPGDPARLVGSAGAIGSELGWVASQDLEAMVASAWAAQDPPDG